MRRPLLAANWKMHKTVGEALAYLDAFLPLVADVEGVEIVLAAPYTALDRMAEALAGSPVRLAAQNVHPEERGAFTGAIAPRMLADLGCAYAILGHSERRRLFGETSEFVARKAAAVLAHGIRPIVCVGESLAERDAGRTFEVAESQLTTTLAEVPEDQAEEVVIAYEPVWCIGTGRTLGAETAQEVHGFVRERLGKRFGDTARRIRILYGGSVTPENVYALMAQPDVDGALVGGASLDPQAFARIVRFEQPERSP